MSPTLLQSVPYSPGLGTAWGELAPAVISICRPCSRGCAGRRVGGFGFGGKAQHLKLPWQDPGT